VIETSVVEVSKDDLLVQARRHFEEAMTLWADNRKMWLEDARFRQGEQWPAKVKLEREALGLPCLVVDKLNQYVRQVVNDARQNRPGPKVSPLDSEASVEAAEAFMGLIRSVWNKSNADEALDTAIDHAAGQGFGWVRVITQHENDGEDLQALGADAFNQELRIRRMRNAMAALLGPHQMADGSDADYGFVLDEVPKERFVKKWPNAKATDWEADGFSKDWSTATAVLVCEYFYKEIESVTLHLLADGTVLTDEEYKKAVVELGADMVPKIESSRESQSVTVKWCRLTGCEILERNKWPGKYIPIVPCYGNESDVEGKVTYSGLIRGAKDPMRLYNYSRSAFAQRVALTPKVPWMAPAEQIDGYDEWKTANSGNHQVLRYRALDPQTGTPFPGAPQRVNASDVPAGFQADMQLAEHDIQGSMGMYNSSLGEKSNEKSGRAITARQREGDVSTFHYHDNQNRCVRHVVRILVDAIPKVYDSKRTVRMLGADGKASTAQIDPSLETAHEQRGSLLVFNPAVGRYDVEVEAGPSFTTKRQESADAMLDLANRDPGVWQTHGDLIVKSQDWPNAEEFAKRFRLTMPPQLRQAIEQADNPEAPSPQVQDAMNAIRDQQAQVDEARMQVQQVAQGLQADKAASEAERAKLDASRKELEAREKIMQSRYEELSAKLQLEAFKTAQAVPPAMPPGQQEPAIAPDANQPPPGVFLRPDFAVTVPAGCRCLHWRC
jgi:hypothetical protein